MKNIKLKEAIKEQGRSMKWVAMKAEICEPSLYSYVSGKRNPSINNALKIAEVLGLPVEQLFEIKIMGKK
jgi:DNA-binding XRE family transcriptional regulator